VDLPENYQKESWQMDADEKLGSVPMLKEEGNQLFKEGKLTEAAQKYADAIGRLEQLMLRCGLEPILRLWNLCTTTTPVVVVVVG
jgi:AH receptor-interacting protein